MGALVQAILFLFLLFGAILLALFVSIFAATLFDGGAQFFQKIFKKRRKR